MIVAPAVPVVDDYGLAAEPRYENSRRGPEEKAPVGRGESVDHIMPRDVEHQSGPYNHGPENGAEDRHGSQTEREHRIDWHECHEDFPPLGEAAPEASGLDALSSDCPGRRGEKKNA
jgi:hypothetical protein